MKRAETNSTSNILASFGITAESHREAIATLEDFTRLVEAKFNPDECKRIQKALHLMTQAHISQRRKDGGLYILHPVEVASDVTALLDIPDVECVIAALLHDTPEDQSETYLRLTNRPLKPHGTPSSQAQQAIGEDFGSGVQKLVSALTNPDFMQLLADQEIDPSHPDFSSKIQAQYKAHVEHAIRDHRVCLIKFADFARNGGAFDNLPDSTMKWDIGTKYRQIIPVFVNRITGDGTPLNTQHQSAMLLELDEIAAGFDRYLGYRGV